MSWGLSWFWNVPVFAIAIILIGGIQHRLAGLGHESSHYSFMKNRTLNDLIPDLFCMFPLFTTIHFYRLFHMGHHQFTNDPARDPDLQNLGHGKRADEFPMPRRRFITVVYFCFLVAPDPVLALSVGLFRGQHARQGKKRLHRARRRRWNNAPSPGRGWRRSWGCSTPSALSLVLKYLDRLGIARNGWSPPGWSGSRSSRSSSALCPTGRSFSRRFGKPTRLGSRDSCG